MTHSRMLKQTIGILNQDALGLTKSGLFHPTTFNLLKRKIYKNQPFKSKT